MTSIFLTNPAARSQDFVCLEGPLIEGGVDGEDDDEEPCRAVVVGTGDACVVVTEAGDACAA